MVNAINFNEERVTHFAKTDARGKHIPFGIKAKDRTRHVYVIGKTGMGKSTLLENMAVQDIKNGEGFAFVDPHGKSADLLLDYIPPERVKDVLYFAPFDLDYPIAFNVMEDVGYDKRHLVVSGLMAAFKKIWVDVWSARMEYILQNTLLALLEYPGATLLDVNRMYTDKRFREKVVGSHGSVREDRVEGMVKDPLVKSFWLDEYATYTDRYTQEATPAIQNKIGQFTGNPLIRNIVGQGTSTFDLRTMLDQRKILIVNLSKGKIGEGNANLLGSMLITKLYLAALSRADTADREMMKLPNFYLYVDEFQSFANESFADILSEARKYKLNLTMAHQYVEQMSEEVRAAVFGNVGTMIVFRIGAFDAEVLEKEFAPQFTAEDLVNLGFAQIYLRLMIDGVSSQPFSAVTLPPIAPPEHSEREAVIENSRAQFARPRSGVEEEVRERYESQQRDRERVAAEQSERARADNTGTGERFERPYGGGRGFEGGAAAHGRSATYTRRTREEYRLPPRRPAPSVEGAGRDADTPRRAPGAAYVREEDAPPRREREREPRRESRDASRPDERPAALARVQEAPREYRGESRAGGDFRHVRDSEPREVRDGSGSAVREERRARPRLAPSQESAGRGPAPSSAGPSERSPREDPPPERREEPEAHRPFYGALRDALRRVQGREAPQSGDARRGVAPQDPFVRVRKEGAPRDRAERGRGSGVPPAPPGNSSPTPTHPITPRLDRSARPETLSGLRDALARATVESSSAREPIVGTVPSTERNPPHEPSQKAEAKQEQKRDEPPQLRAPSEIPEEELKKILDVGK